MLRVVERITQDHDLGLVVMAGMVCVLAASTSARLLIPVGGVRPVGAIRVVVASLAFSIGGWTTHFITMLAFQPDSAVSINIPLCILSLFLAITASLVGYLVSLSGRGDVSRIVTGGIILGFGLGGMHFVGMRSMALPGVAHYDLDLVAAAFGLGTVFGIGGMWLLVNRSLGWAAACLTLAAAGTHFVAIGSVRLEPIGGMDVPPLAMPKTELVMATGGTCLLILGLALTAAILNRRFSDRLAAEAHRLGSLANVTFKALIFERDGRIVDANRGMFALAGTDAASLFGRPLTELIPGLDVRRAERGVPVACEMRLSGNQVLPIEVLWRSGPDRGERIVAIREGRSHGVRQQFSF